MRDLRRPPGELAQAAEAAASEEITKRVARGRIKAVFTVHNPLGIHVRPAAAITTVIRRFKSHIYMANLTQGWRYVDASNIFYLLIDLAAKRGDEVGIIVEGDDAEEAFAALIKALDEVYVRGHRAEQTVTVTDHSEFRDRLEEIARRAQRFKSRIQLGDVQSGKTADAKSLSELRVLAEENLEGHALQLIATGEDADGAVVLVGGVFESSDGGRRAAPFLSPSHFRTISLFP